MQLLKFQKCFKDAELQIVPHFGTYVTLLTGPWVRSFNNSYTLTDATRLRTYRSARMTYRRRCKEAKRQ